jgi:hypothetical protein
MTPTPNWFAFVALLSWPLVALCLYYARPVNQATLWTILGAQLLLPVGAEIKFEGIPQFDKISIPNLAALVGCLLVVRRPPRLWNGGGFAGILILMFVIGPFVTAELNGDPIVLANRILPAESHYDALSAVVRQLLFLLPFFLGRQLLRGSVDNEEVLRVLVIAGLFYSLPILFEARMSPQLHRWFYGYYSHEFIQHMRAGGYRPMVFMGHGLLVAFFAMTTVVAAAALWRMRTRVLRLAPGGITVYLSAMLVLCKSLAALLYGIALVPMVRLAAPRLQLRMAVVLVSVALVYPMLRATDLIPTKSFLDATTLISADRASSLASRFDNEERLLARASERVLFGWGRWGRSRVYDDYGNDISVTDGRWVITIGQFGLFGFLAEFGLLALPVFRAASALRFAASLCDRVYLAALALIVSINIVDLLPNASVSPWHWLLAGALLGRAELLRVAARQPGRFALQRSASTSAS